MTGGARRPPAETEDLDDLYENAPCGFLSLDAQGRIHKVNNTLATWLGRTADELAGLPFRDLLSVAGRMFYETHFAPLLRMQGYFNEVALDLVTADGGRLPVLANATEKRNSGGDLLFTRVALFQAPDRRRYERELVDARSQMRSMLDLEKEQSKLREQFIAVLGHDLRNPLASISSAVQLLRTEIQSEKGISILDLADTSTLRMSKLIDDVLDFARGRLGSGLGLDRNADQPLEPVLHQVVGELRSSHPETNVETEFNVDQPVNCDRVRIGQLASNLLGNALAHGAPDKPVRVGAKTRDGKFEFWVANAGTPISEETLENLFQPFFRVRVRPSRQGLGLGLYISSEIARAHGGHISVRSDENETRFTYVMPLA